MSEKALRKVKHLFYIYVTTTSFWRYMAHELCVYLCVCVKVDVWVGPFFLSLGGVCMCAWGGGGGDLFLLLSEDGVLGRLSLH